MGWEFLGLPADYYAYGDHGDNTENKIGNAANGSEVFGSDFGNAASRGNLVNQLKAWADSNGTDLSSLGGIFDPNFDAANAAMTEQGQAQIQESERRAADFIRQQFGDVAWGKTTTGGSAKKGDTYRTDMLQRMPDGSYSPVQGATMAGSNAGWLSDGIKLASIILPFAGGVAAQGAGAAAEAGAVGVGAGETAGAYGAAEAGAGGFAEVGGDALASYYPALEGGAMAGYGGGTAAEAGFGSAMGYGGAAAGGAGVAGGASAAGGGSNGYVGAATQGLNALLSAYQSKKAADAMQAGGDAANATQRYMFDTINAQGAPYRSTAYNALDNINALQRDPSSVMRDPGYEFGRSQGMRGIDNSASARGGIGGAALKAGSRFNTDYATTKLNDVYARNFQAAGLANGSNALSGSAGMNMANQVGGTQRWIGDAAAGNALNQGNIWGTALNGLAAYGQNNGWWGG